MLDRILQKADTYDILHFHLDYLHFPLFRAMSQKVVTTLHGRQDIPDNKPLYKAFDEMPLISISNHQRRPISQANFIETIPHGIPSQLLRPVTTPGSYLAFLGRISPEKRPDRAIAIAKASGIPLKIAAKVDRADQSYFDQIIRPLLDDPLIEFIGEIGEHEKSQFLGESLGLLFPIDWPEPFGLVMIEAMACGTPVVAFNCGSVPEIIEPGLTGFIVDSVEEAIAAVPALKTLDRSAIRRRFEQRFSARRMAEVHISLYRRLLGPPARAMVAADAGTPRLQLKVAN
jgi:glycosyltransferase involved in cell wall biosynthesis